MIFISFLGKQIWRLKGC